ncbi:MAG: hypothetical protein FWD73_14990 [Polyangiaceae bacterium]|nr:hypothetical protein [Polyangiaceae bacterium]
MSGERKPVPSAPSALSEPAKTKGPTPSKPSSDVVVLGPPTSDGHGVHVLRARNDRVEAGELRALREGQPIVGEIVSLEPRKDQPRICDVRESWSPKPRATSASALPPHKGPAQVSTTAYRDGWDEIFGSARNTSNAKKPNRDMN